MRSHRSLAIAQIIRKPLQGFVARTVAADVPGLDVLQESLPAGRVQDFPQIGSEISDHDPGVVNLVQDLHDQGEVFPTLFEQPAHQTPGQAQQFGKSFPNPGEKFLSSDTPKSMSQVRASANSVESKFFRGSLPGEPSALPVLFLLSEDHHLKDRWKLP